MHTHYILKSIHAQFTESGVTVSSQEQSWH